MAPKPTAKPAAAKPAAAAAAVQTFAPSEVRPANAVIRPLKGEIVPATCPNCQRPWQLGPLDKDADVEADLYRCPFCAKEFVLKRFLIRESHRPHTSGKTYVCAGFVGTNPLDPTKTKRCGQQFQMVIGGNPLNGQGGRNRAGCPVCGAIPQELLDETARQLNQARQAERGQQADASAIPRAEAE